MNTVPITINSLPVSFRPRNGEEFVDSSNKN